GGPEARPRRRLPRERPSPRVLPPGLDEPAVRPARRRRPRPPRGAQSQERRDAGVRHVGRRDVSPGPEDAVLPRSGQAHVARRPRRAAAAAVLPGVRDRRERRPDRLHAGGAVIGAATIQTVVRHAHLFCGIGGGAVGFNRGSARVGNTEARFVCVGGIDSDPAACRDFERKARAPATCRDLFSLDRAFRLRPHIVFLSAPCKGFSGLLSETSSKTARYQALNGLTLRGVWLLLEAYKDDPVELLVFENVPRIATRGRWLLDQIVALLRAYGYAVAETTHDCGELGELGQSRKRFLLVARHQEKVPPFLYEPPKHRLLGVGDVLERLPMPLTGEGGAMHRMPALQWKTWVRLAFVRAGADWRSLNDLAVEGGFLKDFGIVPAGPWRSDVLGVMNWTDTAGTVTSRSGPTNGRFAVAD